MQPDPTQLGLTILGFLVILEAVGTAVAIWAATRRNPPLDRELYKKYALISALEKCREEHAAKCLQVHAHQSAVEAEQFSIMRDQQAAYEKTVQDIMRTLGRIEGKLEALQR